MSDNSESSKPPSREQSTLIKGDLYTYESDTYDYLIRARGWGQNEFQSARKAYGAHNPAVFMGWELDPLENNGYALILRDFVIIESRRKNL